MQCTFMLKPCTFLATFMAALLLPCLCQADDAAGTLVGVLSCDVDATPAQVSGLIQSLGGHTLLSQTALTDVEYTLPNAIEVFGQSVTQITVHPGNNSDGDFTEYRARFDGPAATVAYYAGLAPDKGVYKRETGNNDVLLRFEPGGSYIVCAQGVRSLRKTIKRDWRTYVQKQ